MFVVFYVLWKYSPTIPSYDKILNYKPSLSSRIYSSDGILLKSFYTEERIYIPIERIPTKIKQAFLSAEDKNFYNHYGIDIFAITRAFFTNLISINTNKRLVGASTITQQVVKNLLLSNEISYERKIKEIILAIRIENVLTKNQILELYLNDIYLGYGSYGIGTASLNYFNKSIDQLDLHEIAFLAALPKAPNNYNPTKNYEDAFNRRNWVINKMFKNKFINQEDLKFKNMPIETFDRTNNIFNEKNYYYEEIRKILYKDFGKNKLYSDGLIVKTSINTNFQKAADESLIMGLIEYDKRQGWRGPIDKTNTKKFLKNYNKYQDINPLPSKWYPVIIIENDNNILKLLDNNENILSADLSSVNNKWIKNNKFNLGDVIYIENIKQETIVRQLPLANGAVVVLNPQNGEVLALSGGMSFKTSEFNRATQAKRQPGSAFKPFVYITALKEGYNPSTLILDAPYVVDQGPGLPKWKPANYTEEFYGLTTMRTGIEKSRNLMTVRLANNIGIEKIISTVEDFGIVDGINSNLSMALGSGVVTLLNLTNSYGIIANGGKEISPTIIKSIYSKKGNQIFNSTQKKCLNCKLSKIKTFEKIPKIVSNQKIVIDEKIAYQITSMMEGVIKRGTAKKLKKLQVPIAGKTGTTNNNKDAWFIGYSPDLVIGVYVGHDTPKNLGYKETGSSVAVPIFENFSKKIDINSQNIPFKVPSGLSFVKIDSKTGLPSNNEESILEPFIFGTEPYNNGNINILDSLGLNSKDTISGTGGLFN